MQVLDELEKLNPAESFRSSGIEQIPVEIQDAEKKIGPRKCRSFRQVFSAVQNRSNYHFSLTLRWMLSSVSIQG